MQRRGVIYAVAPSPKDLNTIWCGTDDGLIHVTKDGGKSWKNITPSSITSWSKISVLEASHFDVNTAYAAVNRIRCDDMHPHIYKTNDGGRSWKEIANGLPDDPINVVREDPQTKGLLFAGSERAVYVSFDDGEHWQSLRLNMPASSVRDLVIKDDDIVAGTHGRGFWILDDITSLRQLSRKANTQAVILFKPETATRVRWSMNTDTPIPQEEPAGQNPPDGAIIDYYLNQEVKEVTLEITDEKGNSIRKFTSADTTYEIPKVDMPLYWIRSQKILSAQKGSHRFLWDMHYTPFNEPASYPMQAVYEETAPAETAPWVSPGNYIVKLKVDDKILTQPFSVRMDPRVKTSVPDLQKQHDLSMICYNGRKKCTDALNEIREYRARLKNQITNASSSVADTLNEKDQQAAALESTPAGNTDPSFSRLNGNFAALMGNLQNADVRPTSQVTDAVMNAQNQMNALLKKWSELKNK